MRSVIDDSLYRKRKPGRQAKESAEMRAGN